MSAPLKIPEIIITPSAVPTGELGKVLYAWKMVLHENELLDSEDHGDDFDTVAEALAHAYGVFSDLVNTRELYPANETQEFRVTVTT